MTGRRVIWVDAEAVFRSTTPSYRDIGVVPTEGSQGESRPSTKQLLEGARQVVAPPKAGKQSDRSLWLEGESSGPAIYPHAFPAKKVLEAVGSDARYGLGHSQVQQRLKWHGPNRFVTVPRSGWLAIFARQFGTAMTALLAGAAVISFVIGESLDAIAILMIVLANSVWGALQEGRAEAATKEIDALLDDHARIIRHGQIAQIDTEQIVTGDLVLLDTGDQVPADGRWLQANSIEVDESTLTGESLPVPKEVEPPVDSSTPLAERKTMAFAGTILLGGQGVLLITATGSDTEMGRVVGLSQKQPRVRTPLQVRLDRFASTLWQAAVIICISLAALAWLYGETWGESLLIGVSLAVAAVPEGLPTVVTVTLAVGIRRMARQAAIVRRLSAVEALGSTTVICTDKTGTVTSGHLKLVCAYSCRSQKQIKLTTTSPGSELDFLLGDALLASTPPSQSGDSQQVALSSTTEKAIFTAAAARNITYVRALADRQIATLKPFDSVRKKMSVVIQGTAGDQTSYVKGAPEVLLRHIKSDRRRLIDRVRAWAGEGKRVLLVAKREQLKPGENPESELTPVGLLGFADPPRGEVRTSVREAAAAGVRTVMITGDHPDTALAIARQTGIVTTSNEKVLTGDQLDRLSDRELLHRSGEVSLYARVVPLHKLRIVEALKRNGAVVAMTGDGVNDVPAMRAAHVAVAMGRRGTDAARATADLILTDDNYATIVRAIGYGRTIYNNILRFTHFLLAANAGEVLVFAIAIALGLPAPLTVLQILMVNLLTDGFPAIALGVDPPSRNVMYTQPRPPKEPLLRPVKSRLLVGGLATGLAALTAFLIGNAQTVDTGRTMTYIALVMAQLLHVFGTRTDNWFFRGQHNRLLYVSVIASAALLFLTLLIPAIASRFDIVSLTPWQIGTVVALGAVPLTALELFKASRRSSLRSALGR